jgi:UDP-glucose:(heptosyl)LPS alpha-1,3-glucosyltransferase
VRAEWAIPANADVVLFVGSGFRRKGLDRLLEIWGSEPLKDVFLLVVGHDARLARYKAAAERRAPGQIIFAGRQEAIERFYGAADVVVLPSVQEAFGNVVVEALACGLPVVVSRSVGASELLAGSLVEGIVNNAQSPSELREKLERMLRRARSADTMSEARRLAETYSWTNYFRKLEACLLENCHIEGDGGALS